MRAFLLACLVACSHWRPIPPASLDHDRAVITTRTESIELDNATADGDRVVGIAATSLRPTEIRLTDIVRARARRVDPSAVRTGLVLVGLAAVVGAVIGIQMYRNIDFSE